MKIPVHEIPDEGLDVEGQVSLDAAGTEVVGRATYHLRLERIGREVAVEGEMRAEEGLRCSRCLADFRKEEDIAVRVSYYPIEALEEEERKELGSDELETGFYRGEELDVDELAREQVLLNVPMKPLCSDSCRGICPHCGRNLNEGDCGCRTEAVDVRWDALAKIFKDRKGGEE